MAKKTLLKNFLSILSLKKNEAGNKSISAGKAIDIQNSYINSAQDLTAEVTAPYMEILHQLYSPKPEIFAAALFYLRQIALNNPENAEEIVSALQDFASSKIKNMAERKQQVREAIENIKKQL